MIAGASALSGVEVRGLSRRFGPGTAALDGVDLAMPRGGFLALLVDTLAQHLGPRLRPNPTPAEVTAGS